MFDAENEKREKSIFLVNQKIFIKKNDVRVCLVSLYVTCIRIFFSLSSFLLMKK